MPLPKSHAPNNINRGASPRLRQRWAWRVSTRSAVPETNCIWQRSMTSAPGGGQAAVMVCNRVIQASLLLASTSPPTGRDQGRAVAFTGGAQRITGLSRGLVTVEPSRR